MARSVTLRAMSHDFDLTGRVALVTGSTRGLGRSIAMALGRAGANVALNYMNDEATAHTTFDSFRAHGFRGGLFRGNVVDEADVRRMCGAIRDQPVWPPLAAT